MLMRPPSCVGDSSCHRARDHSENSALARERRADEIIAKRRRVSPGKERRSRAE